VRSTNVREVADAFRYLVSRQDLVTQRRVGVGGFSYGAGPVLLAALKPDIREQVRFIVTLGGYYDLRSIVAYFTTGYYRGAPGAPWRYQRPNPYIKWVFTQSNADLLEHAEDRAALHRLADQAKAGAASPDPATVAALHADGQALVALLTNPDPERVPALVAQLSPRMRSELQGIDPASQDLSQLRAKAILVHGRGDTMIPYTESVALAAALPPEQVQLFLIEGFAHVDVQPQRSDIPHQLAAMQALLAQRAPANAEQNSVQEW
jgi:dienelactone hydrolase